jgi:hypothetical protein
LISQKKPYFCKKLISMRFFIFLLLFCNIFLAKAQMPTRRIAYVIGNAEYSNAPLYNPINDARDMAKTLQNLGFEVKIFENVKLHLFKNIIQQYSNTIKIDAANTVGLFYYSGHGCQVNGKNYLIPTDSYIKRAINPNQWGTNVDLLLAGLREAKNAMNIVILDTCRSEDSENEEEMDIEEESAPQIQNGLASMDAPIGTFIAFATAPGSVANDGKGLNGLYTQELIKALQVPDLSIEQVFKKVRTQVNELSQGEQIPWDNSSLEQEFYFKKSNEQLSVGTVKSTAPQRSLPEQFAYDVCACLSPVTVAMEKIQATPSNTSGEKLERLEYEASVALEQSAKCIQQLQDGYAKKPSKAEEQEAKVILNKICRQSASFFK